MASLKAFLSVMDEFVQEMLQTFPEEEIIKAFHEKLEKRKKNKPEKILNNFMNDMSQHADIITKQDEESLLSCDSEFLKNTGITKVWVSEEIDDEVKAAIWKYLNTMYVLGTTIKSIPKSLLNQIETMAEQCVKDMPDRGGEDPVALPDMSALMAGMQNMMAGMGNKRR